ncbi:MAG: monovalent cation/H(+) antiporter subunit G [Desulfobacterales bacterium]|nr:monovalent cation/H(+) antiporter subunit G [Desulfobacterales bacterium]MBL7207555.1 monovalent cation/H(+) antiporter subunit G [Desulfobacterales bacterium]
MLIITIPLVLVGLFFFFAATVGLIRFPDFYARMHATGKGDTLGAVMVVAGLAAYNLFHGGFELGSLLTSIKIVFIAVFIFLANPTATHALTKAGLDAGVVPWTKGEAK